MSETTEKFAETLAENLESFVNNYNRSGDKVFVEKITLRIHQSLQQSVFRLFYRCIRSWSECYDNGIYDLRNEATCKLSHEIVEFLKEKDGIPFIQKKEGMLPKIPSFLFN